MDKNIERIERYLKGILPPAHESDPHRQRLRRQILGEIERRQSMSARGKAWKIALAVAALVGTGAVTAAVVGVKIHQYYFEGRGIDGAYHFSTGPEVVYQSPQGNFSVAVGHSTVISSNDPNFTIDVEQTRKDLDEVAILRQQGAGELVGVIDTEVNGHFHRTFQYKYTLSDGRTHTLGEGDPDAQVHRTPEQMERDHQEIKQLRQRGERELVRVIDAQVGDSLQRTCSYQYVLADGYTTTVGESDPDLQPPTIVLSPEQTQEMWRLRMLKQGDFLGYLDRDVHGRTFTFETWRLTLADGTVVTHGVGEPKGAKSKLTEADWAEFRDLRAAGKGVDLDAYEEDVKGRMFLFHPQQFILSDGTEFIWSVGKPSAGQ
jgi:hypothetical protein